MNDKTSIVALLGLRCSGKTSVGRRLAEKLGLPFIDLDLELARDFALIRKLDAKLTAGEILSEHGEHQFRDAEQNTLARVLASAQSCVIATGGGIVERAVNRERLRGAATCVWLRVPIAELERRMRGDRGTRPALLGDDPVGEIAALAARREPLYLEVSDHSIECGTLGTAEIARRIESLLLEGR